MSRHIWLGDGVIQFCQRHQRYRAYCDTRQYYNVMFATGIADKFVGSLLPLVVKPGDTVFDVGANVGMVTLLVASSEYLQRPRQYSLLRARSICTQMACG